MNILDDINAHIDKIADFFLTYIVIIMTLAIFVQVIMRYIFNNSLSWSEEFATFCFLWLTWIGASNGVKKQSHIRILILVDKLSDKYRKIVMILIDVVWLMFTVLLVKNGVAMIRMLYDNNRISAALEVPMYIVYTSVVIGGIFMCLGLLSSISARCKA